MAIKSNILQILTANLVLFALQTARAENPVLGDVQFKGDGCPEGTVSYAFSPDQTQVSILFNNFSATTENNPSIKRDRKACAIKIPVEVPRGYRPVLMDFEYRGSVFNGAGAWSRILTEASIRSGTTGRAVWSPMQDSQSYYRRGLQDFTYNTTTRGTPLLTGCGEKFEIDLHTRLITVAGSSGETSIISLDSIDGTTTSLKYKISIERCTGSPRPRTLPTIIHR